MLLDPLVLLTAARAPAPEGAARPDALAGPQSRAAPCPPLAPELPELVQISARTPTAGQGVSAPHPLTRPWARLPRHPLQQPLVTRDAGGLGGRCDAGALAQESTKEGECLNSRATAGEQRSSPIATSQLAKKSR